MKKPTPPAAKKPATPKSRIVGEARLRVVRGPDEEGLWYWRARRHEGGKEINVWAGWASPSDADKAVMDVLRGAPAAKADSSKPETVRDLCEVYLGRQEDRADLTEATTLTLKNMLKRVVAGIGDVLLERLDASTLERHRDTRLRAGGAPATIKAELKRLRAAWTWGQEIGIVPMRALPRPTIKVTPRNCTTTPERGDITAVLTHLDGWMRVAVLLYAATGVRLGELAAVEWGDDAREDETRTVGAMHLSRAVLHVVGKTGHRDVPLAPPVVRLLTEWRGTSTTGSIWPVTPGTLKAKVLPALTAACAAAGVPRFTAQGLRRAAVDLLYRSGADIQSAASVMGHSPTVAMQAYRRATAEDRRSAVALARLGYFDEGVVIPLTATGTRGRGK